MIKNNPHKSTFDEIDHMLEKQVEEDSKLLPEEVVEALTKLPPDEAERRLKEGKRLAKKILAKHILESLSETKEEEKTVNRMRR